VGSLVGDPVFLSGHLFAATSPQNGEFSPSSQGETPLESQLSHRKQPITSFIRLPHVLQSCKYPVESQIGAGVTLANNLLLSPLSQRKYSFPLPIVWKEQSMVSFWYSPPCEHQIHSVSLGKHPSPQVEVPIVGLSVISDFTPIGSTAATIGAAACSDLKMSAQLEPSFFRFISLIAKVSRPS